MRCLSVDNVAENMKVVEARRLINSAHRDGIETSKKN